MKNIENTIRDLLNNNICELINSRLFFQNPETDFTRNRKLPANDVVKAFLGMNGGVLANELYEYFKYNIDTPTASAFIQQNDKILPEFYEFLLHYFTSQLKRPKTFMGYHLLACDGSTINIRTDKNDMTTYIKSNKFNGYNAIHLNALYDLENHIYTNIYLQKGVGSEKEAFRQMIKTGDFNQKTIFIADRGYENYNLFANIEQQDMKYLVRIKDVGSTGILKKYGLPTDREFDIHIHPILTKKQTNIIKNSNKNYVYVPSHSEFDFIDLHTNFCYEMDIRIVRIEIAPGEYECLATNLDESKFSKSIIKEMYHKRWGIETSFRELKYNIGLTHLHSIKIDTILKEIYSKLIMFNYCMAIIYGVAINKKTDTYMYQSNIHLAVRFCKESFRLNNNSINVCFLISQNLVPIRPNRQHKRNILPKGVVCFQYRVAA